MSERRVDRRILAEPSCEVTALATQFHAVSLFILHYGHRFDFHEEFRPE